MPQPDPQPAQPQDSPPAEPKTGAKDKSDEPQMYDVKVGDQTAKVTLAELTAGYGHHRAAEQKMTEAAAVRKAAEGDIRIADLARRIFQDKDQTALRDLAVQFGESPRDVESALSLLRQAEVSAAATPGAAGGSEGEQAVYAKVTADDLDPELRQELQAQKAFREETEGQTLVRLKADMFEETKKRLDTDPVLGKIEDEQVRARVLKHAQDLVQLKVGLLHEPWPGVLEEIVQEIRPSYEHAGNRGGAEGDATGGTAIGPAAAMASGPMTVEPKDKLPMSHPGYKAQFAQRLNQRVAALLHKGGR